MRRASRNISSLLVSEEVRHAVANNKPVVSLESTIITHGLPYPQNLEMAKRVESEIRELGAIPATTAFINGTPKVGLSLSDLELLATSEAVKVSRRDIPYVMANKLHGGTTISGTMILSHKSAIRVFATGGLGGVHRHGETTMDVSADLDELGRTSVAVVCAGPKSILDIERTMEYLETKGVFVGTMGPPGTNIPGFYTRDSGVGCVHNFSTTQEAAMIINEADNMQLETGQLLCIPPPEEVALDPSFINGVIEAANEEALVKGIKGKELTPFLLSKIAQATKGVSVKSNVEFVLNNSRKAAEISKHLTKIRSTQMKAEKSYPAASAPVTPTTPKMNDTGKYNTVVIGSIALDTYAKLSDVVMGDSSPATVTSSIGGVGYNVALASASNGNESLKFVSIIGQDVQGQKIEESISIPHDLAKQPGEKTGQYISFHDSSGALVIAGADMGIVESLSFEFVERALTAASPRVVLVDCNISREMLSFIYKLQKKLDFRLAIEPTSLPKAKKVAFDQLSSKNPIFLVTPTVAELESMYRHMDECGKFDVEDWFPSLDRLGIDSSLRARVEALVRRVPFYKSLLSRGIMQMATSLLPFIENIVVKDGANGVYVFSRGVGVEGGDAVNSEAQFSLVTPDGILLEHYDVPEKLEKDPENVTGAGDTLAGVLLKGLGEDPDALWDQKSRAALIMAAQRAAIEKIR